MVFVIAGLVGIAFGLLAFLLHGRISDWIAAILKVGFFVAWAVMAVSFVVGVIGTVTARYKDLKEKASRDQVW